MSNLELNKQVAQMPVNGLGATIVDCRNITKTVRMSRDQNLTILHEANFQVKQGEMVAIVGASGSGKTTMLGIIGGLDVPTSGEVFIAGQNISKLKEKQLARVRNRTIGFVFQFFNLVPTLTALENVMLPVQFDKKAQFKPEERARELLGLVGLSNRLNNKPTQLSGGEQQRVAIARALANQPALLLGDEPTGNLDSQRGHEILDLLSDLRARLGLTVCIVTHDQYIAARCDRQVHMKDGMLIN
ncbi:ABC transporter ATP-binding protein [Candidatus Chlorohelix allophototropha]|uniref:ABC transporter ATP-binding protein n=1 Tax=Candidatus Chlorohelix allophototropha TaxID=3003348 RepID=A0ABY9B342_9CHLR|nr:ABC transporter ATP-binding protein [Chloroflexota bacterium L227-S17]